jgi:hypothetical protein
VGFFSYSLEDDEGSGGRLSKLRERIQEELRCQLGRTKRDFSLWQDKAAIAHGTLWEDEIKSAIAESVFFIPIITPTAVKSYHCKFEFDAFLAREKELDRSNLDASSTELGLRIETFCANICRALQQPGCRRKNGNRLRPDSERSMNFADKKPKINAVWMRRRWSNVGVSRMSVADKKSRQKPSGETKRIAA